MAERQMHSAVNAAVLRPSEVRVLLGALGLDRRIYVGHWAEQEPFPHR